MGNASSTSQPGAKPNSSFHRRFPSRSPQESARPKSPSTQHTHKPLRNKKRSLELPDLASLGLGITPNNPGSSAQRDRGRTTHSSPINIPVSPHLGGKVRQRPQNNTSYSNIESDDDVLVEYKDPEPERRERGRQPRAISRDQPQHKPAAQIVNSTISTGLRKASATPSVQPEEDGPVNTPGRRSTTDDPVDVKIVWSGGGTSVMLARAGDDDWKGRTVMERERPDSPNFFTIVSLQPGTHHMRFLVDDVWRISDDLPTAVDEQGSLANYVAVGLRVFSPSPIQSSPPSRPMARSLPPGSSFWVETPSGSSTNLSADSSSPQRSLHPYESGKWTSVIPPELILAAKEEEAYIAMNEAAQASGIRHRDRNPPPLPPAPALPRHLEKLILNVRSPGVATPRPGGSPVGARRPADSHSHNRSMPRSLRRSTLGMNAMEAEADSPSSETGPNRPTIPVTTASGTDVSRAGLEPLMTPLSPVPHTNDRSERERIEREKADRLAERAQYEPGLADDSSMLPVPNHVVLHHLSTSAIKNGLLAVASTNRYRKKYLTTIYYKPTDT